MEDDFKQIILLSENEEKDKACVIAALKDLEKCEMIVKEKEFWILKRPFSSYEQTVTIHPPLCHAIAEEINLFCDLIKADTDRCDPSGIRDRDIGNILMLYKGVKAQQEESDGMESWVGPTDENDDEKND